MTIRFSAAARRDLTDIWRFSAERWDRAQADRYLRLLSASFDGLACGALVGRAIDEIRPGYRKHAVGSHVVFYRIGTPGSVEVVRILHRRMDIDRHL